MAITVDVTNAGEFAADTSGTTIAVTTTSAIAAGATIILTGTHLADAGTPQTITGVSGGSLTWTIDKQDASNAGGNPFGIWVVSAYAAAGLASSTTITATISSLSNGARSICVTSFLGIATSSPVDTTSGPNTGSTAAWATASTSIAAGSLLIAPCVDFTNLHTSTVTSPSIEAHDFGSGGFAQTTCYRIESSAGSYTVAGTWSVAPAWDAIAVAYKAAPSAAGLQVPAEFPPRHFGP